MVLKPATRIIGSQYTISPSEISAILQVKDTRGAVEHLLSLLAHKNHPGENNLSENYSPKSFINSPETALSTLDLLFQKHEDIFDRRERNQAQKIVLGIMSLLSEYYGNLEKYNSHVSRDPEQQNELYTAQQKLTDTFHFIVGNIINRDFQTNSDFGDINTSHIIQDEAVLKKIETSSDFPNVRRILGTFSHIDFGENNTTQKEAA